MTKTQSALLFAVLQFVGCASKSDIRRLEDEIKKLQVPRIEGGQGFSVIYPRMIVPIYSANIPEGNPGIVITTTAWQGNLDLGGGK